MEALRKVREFFHEVLVEFRRVIWPSRQEVTGSTSVVIVVVRRPGRCSWAAVDIALSRIVGLVLR